MENIEEWEFIDETNSRTIFSDEADPWWKDFYDEKGELKP